MKKSIIALAAAGFFAVAATQQAAAADGTFSSQAQGQAGPVPVTVTIKDKAITRIDVGPNKETVGIGAVAAPKMVDRIVSAQRLNVDVVSGATVTSKAVLAAVRDCLEQSGANLESWDKAPAPQAAIEARDLTTDILVIGGGGAGMISAINATQQGAQVVLLEKMDFLGGASGICAGGMLIEGSRLQKELGVTDDTPQKFMADMMVNGRNLNNRKILDVYAHRVGPTVDWLLDQGIQLNTDGGVQKRAEFNTPRLLLLKGGCPGYAQTLRKLVKASGAEVLLGTRASNLIVEDGRVVGASAEGEGYKYTIHAKAVILATGGYGANREMLGGALKNTLYYGPVSSTGDGHKMAMEIGAGMQLMDYAKIYYNGLEVAPGMAKSTLTGNARALSLGAIMVDKTGKRVVNEKGTGRAIVTAQSKAGGELFLVMDAPTFDVFREGIKNNGVSAAEVDAWLAQNGSGTPLFAHGETLAEAAQHAGIDAAALEETVKRFNGFVSEGRDEDFGRSKDSLKAPITTGPYYIVEQKPRFATTMGSVELSPTMQVLDTAGKVIEGLYAAGEVANCVHGDDSAPAANVAWVATSAKLASDEAVKFAKESAAKDATENAAKDAPQEAKEAASGK